MNTWRIEYTQEAQKDLQSFDHSLQVIIMKTIGKVSQNPLPKTEGGYGKPLGNYSLTKLAGLQKIKLRDSGIRVVYQVIHTESIMKIIVISLRDDDMVYKLAHTRTH